MEGVAGMVDCEVFDDSGLGGETGEEGGGDGVFGREYKGLESSNTISEPSQAGSGVLDPDSAVGCVLLVLKRLVENDEKLAYGGGGGVLEFCPKICALVRDLTEVKEGLVREDLRELLLGVFSVGPLLLGSRIGSVGRSMGPSLVVVSRRRRRILLSGGGDDGGFLGGGVAGNSKGEDGGGGSGGELLDWRHWR